MEWKYIEIEHTIHDADASPSSSYPRSMSTMQTNEPAGNYSAQKTWRNTQTHIWMVITGRHNALYIRLEWSLQTHWWLKIGVFGAHFLFSFRVVLYFCVSSFQYVAATIISHLPQSIHTHTHHGCILRIRLFFSALNMKPVRSHFT